MSVNNELSTLGAEEFRKVRGTAAQYRTRKSRNNDHLRFLALIKHFVMYFACVSDYVRWKNTTDTHPRFPRVKENLTFHSEKCQMVAFIAIVEGKRQLDSKHCHVLRTTGSTVMAYCHFDVPAG